MAGRPDNVVTAAPLPESDPMELVGLRVRATLAVAVRLTGRN